MTDTVVTPETGTPVGPMSRDSDVANALESVLGPEDYLGEPEADGPAETPEVEAEAESTEVEEVAETEAEPTEDQVEEVEERTPRRYKVKANGEDHEVTFEELKSGYQMGSDYRQKTAKMAEERKVVEAQRQRYETQLDHAIPALQNQLQGKFANVDWVSLAQEDPAEYTVLRAEFDQHNNQIQMAMAEKQLLESQRVEDHKAQLQERIQRENRKLVDRYPVFGDAEKGKEVRTDLKKFLKSEGYTDDDLATLADSRAVSLAYKAMRFDQAQAGAKKAKVASKDAPKVQKAGTPVKTDVNAEKANTAAARVKKSGKVDDLAAWLETQGDIGRL